MSRPKKMLPVLGQTPQEPEGGEQESAHAEADGCTDDCCSGAEAVESSASTPRTREANPEAPEGSAKLGVLERTVVRVEGMDCASCAATVERRVSALPGVSKADRELRRRHDWTPSTTPGSRSRTSRGRQGRRLRGGQDGGGREDALLAHPAGALDGWPRPCCSSLASRSSVTGAPEVARVAAYLAAIVVGGLPIFRAAVAGLRARHLDMNVLMSAATVGAVAIGQWAEAASVVVLFAAGNALQVYAIDRTRGAVRALVRLAPNEVLVRRGGSEVVVPAGEVEVGETVVVRPGERLAVDGRVVEGSLGGERGTGDGRERARGEGSGRRGLLRLPERPGRAARRGDQARPGTRRCRGSRVSWRRPRPRRPRPSSSWTASRGSTRRSWWPRRWCSRSCHRCLGGQFGEWFYRALALLIIACPCALVISTPVTVVSGIGAASRRGILVKGGAALEAAGRLKALAFDKTGTLTEGRPVLSRIVALNGRDEAEVLSLAASLERRSEHPLAHAILTRSGRGRAAARSPASGRSRAGGPRARWTANAT